MHKYQLSFDWSYILGTCSDEPTSWAKDAGWMCPTYANKGRNMTMYCSKAAWIANENCGRTCARFGMLTDRDCAGISYCY